MLDTKIPVKFHWLVWRVSLQNNTSFHWIKWHCFNSVVLNWKDINALVQWDLKVCWFFPLELSLRSKSFRSRFCAKDGERERKSKIKKKERKKEELLLLHSPFLFLINLLQDSCKGKITAINLIHKYNYPFEFFFLCCLHKFVFANVCYEGRYRLCFTDHWQFSFVSKRKTNWILCWMVYSFINYSSRPMRRKKSLSLSKKKSWWKYDPWLVNNSVQSDDMWQPKK